MRWTRNRTTLLVTVCLGLPLLVALASAQVQVIGKVVNRAGSSQAGCQLEFSGPASYRATTNSDGNFFLSSPAHGPYSVLLRRGQLQSKFSVIIDGKGLHPAILTVNW